MTHLSCVAPCSLVKLVGNQHGLILKTFPLLNLCPVRDVDHHSPFYCKYTHLCLMESETKHFIEVFQFSCVEIQFVISRTAPNASKSYDVNSGK